jgi:hypothetical protein
MNRLQLSLLRFLLIAACALLGPAAAEPAAHAPPVTEALTFDSKMIELTLESGKQTADITYRFRNSSSKSVEIAALQAACSCLESKLKDDKKTYLPGEQGEVTARFNVGNLMGTLDKQVVVKLAGDTQGAAAIILNARITIPELLHITPRTLNWKMGAEAATQSQRIRVTHSEPIHITSVVSTNNQFTPQLKTIRDGWEYEVSVTPQKATEAGFAILKISSDSKLTRYRQIHAFAMIKD